jgi:RNA polymerase sigma-70 factor (ECF subfamily)
MPNQPDTDALLELVSQGDHIARDQLLARHRARLRKMVALRMDRRLVRRVDPSDVVQEALVEAARRLPEYLRKRPMAYYPWLRQLTWARLLRLNERHVGVGKRSMTREEGFQLALPPDSAWALARRLIDTGTEPDARVLRKELCQRVQAALAGLSERDREVLVLRYVEQLSTREAADVLGVGESALKMRHLRALERLRAALDEEENEGE